MSKQQRYFTGIEIGTSTVKVLIAEAEANDSFAIIGRGEATSWKVMKGEVTNAEIVEEALIIAVRQAEIEAGVALNDTCMGLCVSGSYLSTVLLKAEVNTDRTQVVSESDVRRVIMNARKKDISDKVEVLGTSVKYFSLADGRQLLNPIGQVSESLQVVLMVFTANRNRLETPCICVQNQLDKEVNDICYAPLALGKACLAPDSVRNDGQIIVDVGGGVTSYGVFTMAGCYTAGQLCVGCDHAANDLALAFKLPIQSAQHLLLNLEKYKLDVILRNENDNRLLDIDTGPGGQMQRIPVASIVKVIEVRFEELFEVIAAKLCEDGAFSRAAGQIQLSGGAARLPGMLELAQRVFGRPVVLATPYGFEGPADIIGNPSYCAVMGTLRKTKESLDIYLEQMQKDEEGHDSKTFVGKIIRTLFNA